WPRVVQEIPDARLLVAGKFWEDAASYRKRAAELGVADSIEITDRYIPNDEVGDWFAQADVVVLPYRSATQSGIVQIAYGFDLPVIVTRVGGLPEVVEEGGTGLIVPPEDPAALAEAIIRFFREGGRARYVERIREYRKRFDWSALVDRIEAIAGELRTPADSPREEE
ncbi:MAG TPA: glycosyltransferase, partial [bacterium]|nr:glycosyltransferase [bacterium]